MRWELKTDINKTPCPKCENKEWNYKKGSEYKTFTCTKCKAEYQFETGETRRKRREHAAALK